MTIRPTNILKQSRTKRLLTLCLCLFAMQAAAQKIPDTVNLSLTSYPPILDIKGSIGTDLAAAAFSTQGIQVQYHQYPMPRVFWAMQQDNIDAVLGSKFWLDQQQLEEAFTPISVYSPQFYFFALKENFPQGIHFNTLHDLKDKDIVYIKGGALTPIFEKFNIKPHLVSRLEQSPHLIKSGRRDMFAALELAGWNIIQQTYPNALPQFIRSEKSIYTMTGDILFPDKSAHLVEVFNAGLIEIINNGTYLDIMKKYYKEVAIPESVRHFMRSTVQPNKLQKNDPLP